MKTVSLFQSWMLAFRPQTLIASISPVAIGTTLALKKGYFEPIIFLFTLAFAIFIQIEANLANDYFDFINGADTIHRKGPLRVCQAGLISLKQMKIAMISFLFLAFLSSLYLIWVGGLVFSSLMCLSLIFALSYTGGPIPLGYIGLGDLLVLIFFGPVATIGSFYLQTHVLNWAIFWTSLSPGFLSVAILTINNLRDRETDKTSKKNTLVILLGKKWGQLEYLFCFAVAFIVPLLLFLQNESRHILYTWMIFPIAIPLFRQVFTDEVENLNKTLQQTAFFLTLYTLVFCLVF